MSDTTTRQRRDRPRTSDRRSDGRSADRSTDRTRHDRPADRLRRRLGNRELEGALADHDRGNREDGASHDRAVERVADLLASEAGRPLPPTTRREMATRFGHDFTGVRVHDGPAAARTAESLDAAAYTVGSDVVFGEGFDPVSFEDRLLLAHELAHVVQGAGDRPLLSGVSAPGDRAEADATRAAFDVVLGSTHALRPYAIPVIARADTEWWQDLYSYGGTGAGVLSLVNDIGIGSTGLGGGLGALGLASGVAQMLDPASSAADVAMGGASAYSGGMGVLGSIFPSLAAGGSSGVGATALGSGALGTGGAWGSLGAGLGSAGAVIGAGLAGYGLGTALDEGSGWVANETGFSGWMDDLQGIRRPEGQHGDYSLSGLGSMSLMGWDRMITEGRRDLGLVDESKPEYTQTVGWWLAENLPSWMQ
jgi:hypothetical protein